MHFHKNFHTIRQKTKQNVKKDLMHKYSAAKGKSNQKVSNLASHQMVTSAR